MDVNNFLENLREKKEYIEECIRKVKKIEGQISEIDSRILDIRKDINNLIKIGIWDKNIYKKEVEMQTSVYDQIEQVVDKHGGYDYLADVEKEDLINVLLKIRVRKEKEIEKIKDEMNKFMEKN